VEAAVQALGNASMGGVALYEDEKKKIVRCEVWDYERNIDWSKEITIEKTVERSRLKRGQVPIAKRKNSYGEDVFILPGDIEDRVYYVVRREINGSIVRYVEKWALESECLNGPVNKVADSCVTYTGTATTTITGLSHLEGESVVVWANGIAIADGSTAKPYKVVSGGQITLSTAATNVTVGLPYRARFKSAKLAYGAQLGTALGQKKQIKSVNLVLANAHILSVKLGQSFDELERMPSIEEDDYQDDDTVYDVYDEVSIPVRGRWDTDSRLCLEINAPYSAKVLGVVIGLEAHEKA